MSGQFKIQLEILLGLTSKPHTKLKKKEIKEERQKCKEPQQLTTYDQRQWWQLDEWVGTHHTQWWLQHGRWRACLGLGRCGRKSDPASIYHHWHPTRNKLQWILVFLFHIGIFIPYIQFKNEILLGGILWRILLHTVHVWLKIKEITALPEHTIWWPHFLHQ